jgi:hypothetical protein
MTEETLPSNPKSRQLSFITSLYTIFKPDNDIQLPIPRDETG